MKRALIAALLMTAAVVGVGAASGSADGVPRHDHFLVLSSGAQIQIGPRVCRDSNMNSILHTAFHNFHNHVHTGTPTANGSLTVIRSAFCEPED
jgi:hypothetical protein